MTHDPLARVTKTLKDAVSDAGDVSVMPAGRDATIAKLSAALAARARSRRRNKVLGMLAVAAGVVVVAGASAAFVTHRGQQASAPTANDRELARVREPASAVTAMRDGHAEPLGAGARVGEGTELRTPPGGEVHLDFDTGTGVSIAGATRVRLVEQNKKKRFALEAGSFSAHVAKLSPEERFVVATSDAEIEVRGTQFRVSIAEADPACGGGTPTRLEVSEGVVVVRHAGEQVSVSAGQRWPVCAAKTAASEPVPTTTAARVAVAPPSPPLSTSVAATTTAATPAASVSRLQQQNDLFDEGMKAKREGRTGAALATFERLLSTYPQGPLAENATVERMRLLGLADRARARVAAQDYLARYPHGFARAEAEALAATDR
jgi:ferric-dicitrate binding protein FerR (iron transport regulator)